MTEDDYDKSKTVTRQEIQCRIAEAMYDNLQDGYRPQEFTATHVAFRIYDEIMERGIGGLHLGDGEPCARIR